MRFRWRKLVLASALLTVGWWAARRLASVSADTIPIAPREIARTKPLGLVAIVAAVAAGLAAYAGVRVYNACEDREQIAMALTHAEGSDAPELLIRYGCAGCHTIPGVPGADGQVGPQLSHLRSHVFVGGVTQNSAGNLIRWMVDPPSLSPRTAMPATGVSEAEARRIAAWLYAH